MKTPLYLIIETMSKNDKDNYVCSEMSVIETYTNRKKACRGLKKYAKKIGYHRLAKYLATAEILDDKVTFIRLTHNLNDRVRS